MMPAIPAKIVPKIGALIRLLGSDQDGEALGAARGLTRTLSGAGLSLHDLAASVEGQPRRARAPRAPRTASTPPQAQQSDGSTRWSLNKKITAARTLRTGISRGLFTDWEIQFATDIIGQIMSPSRPRDLSWKQAERVNELLAKVDEARR